MKQNSYLALLDHDFIKIRHPLSGKEVKLHRIIATKSFHIPKYDLHIDNYTIGGYVQSIENLDPDNPVWVGNRARVFDNAKIINDSYVSDQAIVYGDAEINGSRIEHHARIYDKARVLGSHVTDLATIKGNVVVEESNIHNAALLFENAYVGFSTISNGSSVRGNCKLSKCKLSDIAQCNGDAVLTNCVLSNGGAVNGGEHFNSTIANDIVLKEIRGTD